MKLTRDFFILLAFVVSAMATYAQVLDESRLALLIGNSSYKTSPLKNPVNDVRLMESALTEAGFKVIKAENASRRDMQRMIRDFGERLKQSGGVGLFYFAGHGVQVRGVNYLIPVDADIRAEDEVAFDSVDAQSVLEKMETAKNRINLLILEACRDNPFAKNSRTGSAGLATMSAPSGSLVAYSTAPGSVASDGAGQNGLYTQHLAAVMRMPDMPIEEVFKRVRASVRKDSANQQTPWENTALEGNFYFKRSPPGAVTALASAPAQQPIQVSPAAPNMMAVELSYWDSIKTSNRPFELEAYVEQFPNGMFVSLAKARLREVTRELTAAKEREDRAAVLAIAAKKEPQQSSAQLVAMVVPPTSTITTSAVVKTTLNFDNLTQGQSIGTLILHDRRFDTKTEKAVLVTEKTNQALTFNTGDKVSTNGNVIAVRIYDTLMTLAKGNLWQLPLQVGARGKAEVQIYGDLGEVEWQIKPGSIAGESYVVQAEFNVRKTAAVGFTNMSGVWTAEYKMNQMLPNASSYTKRPSGINRYELVTSLLIP